MSEDSVVLKVREIGKTYPVYKSNLHRFARWFGLPVKPAHSFDAIKSISFDLHDGESIGLIGQNGAGKSTLLKLITGTIRPNSGKIEIGGSISAILELGLGFNPEFTGRENVRHSAGLLGHSPKLIRELMPQIEEFAEIGEFFDEPVRTYSSGMQARLAFALATAVRPEILIVDEVLSVGDSYFQHKSFARIREFREQGSTIIIVTHSLGDVRELCDRVILLDKGIVLKEGQPDEVIDFYNAIVADRENSKLTIEQKRRKDGWLHTEFGDGRAKMVELELYRAGTTEPVQLVRVGEQLQLRGRIEILDNLERLVVGHRITDRTGHVIWGTNTHHLNKVIKRPAAGDTIYTELSFRCDLGPGSYALHFGIHSMDTHLEDCFHKAENQIVFDVINATEPYFMGSNNLPYDFDVRQQSILASSNST